MSMGLVFILNERDFLFIVVKKKNVKSMLETVINLERVDSIVFDFYFEFFKIIAFFIYIITIECSIKLFIGQEVFFQDFGYLGLSLFDFLGFMNLFFLLQRGLFFDYLNQGIYVLMDILKYIGYSLINLRYIGGILRFQNREGMFGVSFIVSCEQVNIFLIVDKSDVIYVIVGKILKSEVLKISLLFGRVFLGGVFGALIQLR